MTDPSGPGFFVWSSYHELLDLPGYNDVDPEDRPRLWPSWLTPAVCPNDHARARLRAWVEGGGLSRDYSDDARRALVDLADIVADETMRPHAEAVLKRLPPPLLDHAASNCTLVLVGGPTAGWCANRRARAGATESWTLAATIVPCSVPRATTPTEEFQGTICHELAHAWLLPPSRIGAPPVTQKDVADAVDSRERMAAAAHEWNLVPMLTEPHEADEALACALTRALGFVGTGADGRACALGVRARVEAEAQETWRRRWPEIAAGSSS